jgi:hypothetical protein
MAAEVVLYGDVPDVRLDSLLILSTMGPEPR